MITTFVAYLFTEDHTFAMKIGLADSLIKLLVYYLHERAWIRAPFGRDAANVEGEQTA